MKIFTDDELVKYVNTTISPERTKDEISAKLVEYHVVDVAWHWKPDVYDIFVQFGIEEVINGKPVMVIARVTCPTIWNRANPKAKTPERRREYVDLKASMRAMYWYIKSHLETAYAMQSSMVAGFLPDIVTNNNERYFDTVIHRVSEFAALPEKTEKETPREVQIVKRERINVTNM